MRQANTALNALPIEWDLGPNADFDDEKLTALLESGLDADEAFQGNWEGDKAALEGADHRSGLQVPFVHAPMEPMNSTAIYTEDKCEIWCPTQNGESALAATSEASGLPIEKCEVYKTILGEGLVVGERPTMYQVIEIAKAFPGTPIKLQWTREEDQKHGFFHPTTMAKMRGSLDKDGNLTGLHMRISGQSIWRHSSRICSLMGRTSRPSKG